MIGPPSAPRDAAPGEDGARRDLPAADSTARAVVAEGDGDLPPAADDRHPALPGDQDGAQLPLHERGDRASRQNSMISESWLREGGASASMIDFDFGGFAVGGGGPDALRLDRSASFDDELSYGAASAARERAPSPTHRRIGSTGGTRPPVGGASFLSQLFEAEEPEPPAAPDALLQSHGPSALHDAARITDWPAVLALSRSHPELAAYVGPDGWNALHHACDRRCPLVDVMDSLLTANPETLVQTNDKGWTPLHRACRNKTPRDVVRLLLRKYPELGNRAAAMRCNDGRSALHYALLYDAPEGVVDLLLQADPGAVLDEDDFGATPLGGVWDKYANSFDGRRTLQMLLRPFEGEGWELGGNDAGDSAARLAREEAERKVKEAMGKTASPPLLKLQARWQKANVLLRAYFHFPLQEDKASEHGPGKMEEGGHSKPSFEIPPPRKRKWRILHATSAIKCHPSLFVLARAFHPEEALEIDENDLLGGGRDDCSGRTALHFAAMSPSSGIESQKVIKALLKLNPRAARHVDSHGSLPLHLIAQNDRKLDWSNDGARDISNAHPGAASARDSLDRTPLHCATSSAKHCTHSPAVPAGDPPPPPPGSVIGNLVLVDGAPAAATDRTGRLPLHYIAEHGEVWNAEAQATLRAYPAAARLRAGAATSNKLPLHLAAASPDARPSLIMNLLSANPRAASIVDGLGRLPLHHAVDSGRTAWDRGIDAIYSAFIPAISAREDSPRGWTVLHTAAASHSAGCELIEHIIGLNANAASTADGEGKYPLHLACATNRLWESGGVRAIFDADPSVALIEDSSGMLPFHVAATRSHVPGRNGADNDDLEVLEVLFNLLIAQPSIVQL